MAPLDLGFIRAVKNDASSLAELVTLYQPWKQKSPSLPKGFFGVLVWLALKRVGLSFLDPETLASLDVIGIRLSVLVNMGLCLGGFERGFLVYFFGFLGVLNIICVMRANKGGKFELI